MPGGDHMTRPTDLVPTLLACVLGLLSVPASAEVFCVDNATGLQAALTTAASNGEDDQVQIVQSTYVGNFVYASTEAYNLAVQGGWTEDCVSRVINTANTVLDGNQTGTVLVLSMPGRNSNILVHGLTLTKGQRESGDGGGLYVLTGSEGSVILERARLYSNEIMSDSAFFGGGAGAFISTGDATVTNNVISNNSGPGGSGGGLYIYAQRDVTIIGNIISDNHGENGGGGVKVRGASILISHNLIERNSTGAFGKGGGIYSTGTISNNIIFANSTRDGDGGGIYSPGSVRISNNTIVSNSTFDAFFGYANGGGSRSMVVR